MFDTDKSPHTESAFSRATVALRRKPVWLIGAFVLSFVFYGVSVAHFGREPLRIEEGEWPPMAKAIYETGKPIIEADKTHKIRFNPDLTVDRSPTYGAWHPPLYLYTLAASMGVVGTNSPYRLRLVGVAGLMLAICFFFLIAREITPRWRLVGGVAAILALIHPLVIQDSVFLDIDPSVYAPPALLVLWLAIRYGKRAEALQIHQLLAIGGAIALVTWAKMTTTIDLLGVLVVWWLLSRRPVRGAIIESVSFVAVGMALFFSTYALWCAATGIPFSYTFDVTFVGKHNRLFSSWTIVEHAIHWHLRWIGAAIVLLSLVYLVDLIRNFIAKRCLRPMDLPFLTRAAIVVQYVLLSPTDGTYQGKYVDPGVLMLLLSISWMLLRRPVAHVGLIRWALAGLVAATAALLVPDVLTGLAFLNVNYGSWTFELRILAAVGAALLVAWWLAGQRGFVGGALLVTAALLIAQSVHSYRADTSPMYPIPDTADFNAAVNDVNHTLGPGDIVIAAKDIGYYVTGRVFDGEEAFVLGDQRVVRLIERDPRITAFARDSFGPPVGPKTEALLDRCFTERHLFGTASVVYRTKPCG